MNLRRLTGFLAVVLSLVSSAAHAQSGAFPSRPLRIIVPTTPGSGSDITARFFGEQLAAALGQVVTIENRAGGNGLIAAMATKQAPADGYTMFLATNTHMAVNPVVVKDIPYDSVKDFKPVSGLARGMMIFIAPVSSRIASVSDLVNASRTAPKQLSVGSYTPGFHLSAEWFAAVSATKHVYVPFRGAPEVFTALIGEQIEWGVSDLIAALPQVKSGRLRAIAVSGERRHPDAPDIPTVKEAGFADYVNYTWTSLYVRSETPEPETRRLVDAMQKVFQLPATAEFIARIGSDPLALGPDEMRRFQLSETERFRRIAAGAGITPQ